MSELRLHPDDLERLAKVLDRRRLHPADLEALADLVAERLAGRAAPPSPGRMLTVRELATVLGVSCDWVYEHARELGGRKLGDGPRAPWRFDEHDARERLGATRTDSAMTVRRPPRARHDEPKAGRILAIRGEEA